MGSIPYVDKCDVVVKYARSSGPGGQHVNKTESKVDMRVKMEHIRFPSPEARARLLKLFGSKINKNDELVVTSEEHRDRRRNQDECERKITEILETAATIPKERNMNSKTKGIFNKNRLVEKKAHSKKKQDRRKDWD